LIQQLDFAMNGQYPTMHTEGALRRRESFGSHAFSHPNSFQVLGARRFAEDGAGHGLELFHVVDDGDVGMQCVPPRPAVPHRLDSILP
jgi:hypothetical protein